MPWDDLPAHSGPEPLPALDPEEARKLAVVAYVNAVPTAQVPVQLIERDLSGVGAIKVLRQRLAKALLAEGWTPNQPTLG